MESLNPCCSGQWSSTKNGMRTMTRSECLNPCCSGQWSSTTHTGKITFYKQLS